MEYIVSFLREHHRFVVASHLNPDGDSIGSLLATTLSLRALGKEVHALSSDPIPLAYSFLPGTSLVSFAKEHDQVYDGAILLECSTPDRTGIKGLEKSPLIVVDHHVSSKPEGLHNWIDPSFASVAQMVFRILENLGASITPDIASCLYAALLTDTGSFQFNNTTQREFLDAARLVSLGANPDRIAQMVFNANRPEKIMLTSRVLSTMQMAPEKRVAWIVMDQEMVNATGALPEETEGIIHHLMSIHSVQIAAFFKQRGEGHHDYRVSLRSKGSVDISSVAQRFSGGGHRNAAGFTLHEDLETGLPKVIHILLALVSGLAGSGSVT